MNETESAFLSLIGKDIDAGDNILPLSANLLARINRLCDEIAVNLDEELKPE